MQVKTKFPRVIVNVRQNLFDVVKISTTFWMGTRTPSWYIIIASKVVTTQSQNNLGSALALELTLRNPSKAGSL